MVDQAHARLVTADCGAQRTLTEIGIDSAASGTSNDLTVEQILDDGQIQPAFTRSCLAE